MSISNYHNLLYTAIAKDGQLLIQYTDQQGNFQKVAQQIIEQVKSKSRQSYKHHLIKFHTYHDGEYLFLCIVDEEYQKRIAYNFLDQLKSLIYELPEEYRNNPETLQKYYYKALKQQFEFFNTTQCDKTLQVEENIQDLKQTLLSNLDKCIARGEKIDVLVEKSQIQVNLSTDLRKNSKKLKNIMWWKSKKIWLMLGLITIFTIYFILVFSCGGFDLNKCIGGKQKDPVVLKNQQIEQEYTNTQEFQQSSFEDLNPSFLPYQK